MFASKSRNAVVELMPGEEKLYRLPPMTPGPVIVKVHGAEISLDPRNRPPHESEPGRVGGLASDLEIHLTHPGGVNQRDANSARADGLWHDDKWRLRIVRRQGGTGEPRSYRIELQYPTHLPVLERTVPVECFVNGFEMNWNRQQYLHVTFGSKEALLHFEPELRAMYDLENPKVLKIIHNDNVSLEGWGTLVPEFKVGAGPAPGLGTHSFFIEVRAEMREGAKVTYRGVEVAELPKFTPKLRLYLYNAGPALLCAASIIADELFDELRDLPDLAYNADEEKRLMEREIEFNAGSIAGFIRPWLVGGPYELYSVTYVPGPGDRPNLEGIVENPTGHLVVQYLGERAGGVPEIQPTIGGSGGGTVDDGAERLWDLPGEEPDPVVGNPLDPFRRVRVRRRQDPGALSKITHIVALMQENRSFDQMFGYLSREMGRTDVDGLNTLPPDPTTNPQVNRYNNRNYFSRPSPSTAWPDPGMHGPGHDFESVLSQMDGGKMSGFVSNFSGRAQDNPEYLQLIMDYFQPQQVPVFDVMQREFAICDRWFTSHAGPTWPNRFVFFTGDLNRSPNGDIEKNNPDIRTMLPLRTETIFDKLSEAGVGWKVFEHGYSFLRLFGKYTYDIDNIVDFTDPVSGFEAACATGTLPTVSIIEPDYIECPPGNDDHAPADVADGQNLINRILQALINWQHWETTLFVVTYDEHGGFYDHVPPPTDAPPLIGGFRTYGPRVPGIVVSPLIPRGSVFHETYCHTSIGATILRRFGGPFEVEMSPRMDAARDFRNMLTLDQPRSRGEFLNIGLPQFRPWPADAATRTNATGRRIGTPEGVDDFHWLLSAMRLVTGSS